MIFRFVRLRLFFRFLGALSGETLIRPSLPFQIGFLISFLGMTAGILFPVFSKKTHQTRIKGA
ncbi:hypothetical protein CH375_15420 [Leptospira ellisii]|nr:hypothetical protein CH375_15420 [Leptospira ellisii]